MSETIGFLTAHGYTMMFAFVLAEQIGLPVPALVLPWQDSGNPGFASALQGVAGARCLRSKNQSELFKARGHMAAFREIYPRA